MKPRVMRASTFALVWFAVLFPAREATAAVIVDLGTLGGISSGDSSVAVNDSGQVVGKSDTVGNAAEHAFLWTQAGGIDLGTLGGTFSGAVAVNASGPPGSRRRRTSSCACPRARRCTLPARAGCRTRP